MHRNGIFYALIGINNHVLSCLISMLSDVLGVVHLHPWSLRTLKDPLYIRLYFLSLLLFFCSLLALGYWKEEERMSRPKEIIS